jgi:hypothetical protein
MFPIKKALLVTSALLFPTLAIAQTDQPDPLRIVSDPMYLPLAGQLFGSTEYLYGDLTQDVYNAAGVRTAKQTVDSNAITQTFRYGITNSLSVYGDIGYDPSITTRTAAAGGSTSESRSGWVDPSFGATYRVIDQADAAPVSWDFTALYSPDAFSAKSQSLSGDGLVGRGGDAFDLSTKIGHVWDQFTLAGEFHANYSGQRDIADVTGGTAHTVDSNWVYSVDLASQYRFTDRFSVNAGAAYQFAYDESGANHGAALAYGEHVGGTPSLNASLNYDFIPNQVVASLEYEHRFNGNQSTIYPTAPADNSALRNRDEDLVGVNLRYVIP